MESILLAALAAILVTDTDRMTAFLQKSRIRPRPSVLRSSPAVPNGAPKGATLPRPMETAYKVQ